MNLENKVVVVTGGSAGLGEQICYEAAKRGAIVVTCARRTNLIGKVKEQCMELSGKEAYAFQLDVANPESVARLLEKISEKVGKIDVFVNNAGYGIFQEFTEMDPAVIRNMFEVNVLGMMVLTQQVAIQMAEQKHGHIINVASIAGKIATPKTAVYSATKFAVLGFSNALRLELKPLGINVTTVNPGPIETAFFDQADPSGSYLSSVGSLVLEPNKLAQTIVKAMIHPKREINRPYILGAAAKLYTLFPAIGDLYGRNDVQQKIGVEAHEKSMACYRWYFTDFSDRFICGCKQYDCSDQFWLHNDSIATDLSHYWFCFVRRIDFVAGFHKRNVPPKKRTKAIEKRALRLSFE